MRTIQSSRSASGPSDGGGGLRCQSLSVAEDEEAMQSGRARPQSLKGQQEECQPPPTEGGNLALWDGAVFQRRGESRYQPLSSASTAGAFHHPTICKMISGIGRFKTNKLCQFIHIPSKGCIYTHYEPLKKSVYRRNLSHPHPCHKLYQKTSELYYICFITGYAFESVLAAEHALISMDAQQHEACTGIRN